ncbi:tetratricopeptide repeat protein [Halorubrum sp. T3]|uniref:tetratricopeptide repeat protein n=1 Tax=Halorubrum sp. T3 TaxID=1194088 RepID=UPI00036B3827|nr:tetratricopeptide repeat protein [Halorubrum sp. T3]
MPPYTQGLLNQAEKAEAIAEEAAETLRSELVVNPTEVEDVAAVVRTAVNDGDMSEVYARFIDALERALRIRIEVFLLQQSTDDLENAIENVEQILADHRRKATIPYTEREDGQESSARLRLEPEEHSLREWERQRHNLLDAILGEESESTERSSVWNTLGKAGGVMEGAPETVQTILDESFVAQLAGRINPKTARFGVDLIRDFLLAFLATLAVNSVKADHTPEEREALASAHVETASEMDGQTAKVHYERALKIDPENAVAHHDYAVVLHKLKQFQEAKAHYERALEIDPDLEIAHRNYALLLQYKLKKFQEAKAHYEQALEIGPDSTTTQFYYARLLHYDLKQFQEAKAHYEKTLEWPSAGILYNYAQLLQFEFEQFQEAKAHYERALEKDPENAVAHHDYALLLHYDLKQFQEAKAHYERALEIDPGDATTHYNYALCLRELNYPFKARKHERKAKRLS